MAADEVSNENVLPITLEDLTKEKQADLVAHMKNYEEIYLECFWKTRNGVVQTTDIPRVALNGEAMPPPPQVIQLPAGNLSIMVNEAMHQALVDQAGMMVNTLQSLIQDTMDISIQCNGPRGPVYSL